MKNENPNDEFDAAVHKALEKGLNAIHKHLSEYEYWANVKIVFEDFYLNDPDANYPMRKRITIEDIALDKSNPQLRDNTQ